MKNKLKRYLKKHKWVKAFVNLIIKRKDNLYIDTVADLMYNPDVICFEPSNNKKKPILCVIQAGKKTDGFFACVRWALDGLYFCEHFGIEPIIRFADDSLYSDDSMPKNKNPFEYYFVPTSLYSEKDVEDHIAVKYGSWNRMLAENLNGSVSYRVNELYITEMARVMEKYLKFNKSTQQYIDKVLKTIVVDERTLGIQIRGTDYRGGFRNHPVCIQPEDYYPYIDEAMNKYGYQKIFIATDDKEFLLKFLEYYGKENIVYSETNTRGSGNAGIHFERKEKKYELGLEVISDMCLLANCGGIVSGMSQVALCARIYRKSKQKNYGYDKVIDKGIFSTGKRYKI